jgi:hypothetical protein
VEVSGVDEQLRARICGSIDIALGVPDNDQGIVAGDQAQTPCESYVPTHGAQERCAQ